MELDLGDITLSLALRVKAFRPPRFVWRIGAPVEGPDPRPEPGPRRHRPRPHPASTGAWIEMDLKADQQVTASFVALDEIGNPTTFDGTVSYSVTDPEGTVALTDNGDGTAVVAATGVVASSPENAAVITATATRSDGATVTGVDVVRTVAGDAETFAVQFSEPTEVTPDEG